MLNALPDHTGEDVARQKLEPRGLGRLLGRVFSRTPKPELAHLPRLEQVWFPHYLVRMAVVSRKGPGEMLCTVEAWSGALSLIQLATPPEPRDLVEQVFPPQLDTEAASKIARRDLTAIILRQRSRGPKPELQEVLACDLVYFPYWIYYYARRGKFIDIRVLNGATGERVGNRTRAGVLEAFMAAAE